MEAEKLTKKYNLLIDEQWKLYNMSKKYKLWKQPWNGSEKGWDILWGEKEKWVFLKTQWETQDSWRLQESKYKRNLDINLKQE